MSLKGNCVNVLNRTVSTVCKLENQVQTNTENIDFLMKYLNFNKNLLLSILGTDVRLEMTTQEYYLSDEFYSNELLKSFIIGLLNYFNKNLDENSFLLIENINDIPYFLRSSGIKIPSLLQVSFIEPDKSELISFIDSVKSGNLAKLSPVIDLISANFEDPNSFAISILEFLAKSPEISFFKETIIPINGVNIGKIYEDIQRLKDKQLIKIGDYLTKNIQIKGVLETVNLYLRKATEILTNKFKEQSINDPFAIRPSTEDFLKKALSVFLEDHNLSIDKSGQLLRQDLTKYTSNYYYESNHPYQPFEPSEPYSPYEPSDFRTNILTHFGDATLTESQTNIENKIKQLLELTESTTDN